MKRILRIGTRESRLAVWQANQVRQLLEQQGVGAELVFIKSDGDIDLSTPLYELGVQGIFTKALDAALLNDQIDIAVHSMKDVPTKLAQGLSQAAVLPRASYKDLLVLKDNYIFLDDVHAIAVIATSSIRRKAQWLNRFPNHVIENLRGNVNTRLQKLKDNNWQGAIFAAAGLDRIEIRPENSLELDWMLPAPAQGAIMVACRTADTETLEYCNTFNDKTTEVCTRIEREFLRTLMGGCSTPISALARMDGGDMIFEGNLLNLNGRKRIDIKKIVPATACEDLGTTAAEELIANGGREILAEIRNAGN
ncbi:MAG: hydroxymethylbilane synthase [Sphingobacteriales bacterium]|nr:MAG: hydroxymethylbilane synthase [Sphingobacteriales bacterium]